MVPPRLDGAGGAVADLEEAHQAARLAAAGQRLALAAQRGEIGARAGSVFEDARLADPQVHDAAFVDQVVGDGLDEAVVDDDVVGQELPALGLDVVDVFDAGGLHRDDGFFAQRRQPLARESIRAGAVEFVSFFPGDESDQLAEPRARLAIADENGVGHAAILPGIDPPVDARIDPEVQQERQHAPREAGYRRQTDLRRAAMARPQRTVPSAWKSEDRYAAWAWRPAARMADGT